MKSQLVPVTLTGANVNSSGLAFSRLAAGAPVTWPVAGLGLDQSGNVLVTDAGFRNVSLADVATPANSSADQVVLTAAFPAGSMTAGTSGVIRMFGQASSAAASTFNLWVKIGSTKVVTASFYSGLLAAFNNSSVTFNAYFTVRTSGSSANVIWSFDSTCPSAATSPVIGSSLRNFDSTAAQTITAGINWNGASAANVVTINQCLISPV